MPANRLTVLGDSFAEGWGDPAPNGRFHGWVSRFAGMLNLPLGSVRNLGVYGATTQHVVDSQLPRALGNKAPLIGVVVGTNDLLRDYDSTRFRRNLRTLFDSLTGWDTTVLTASYPDIPGNLPIPDSFREFLRERFTEANAALEEIARSADVVCLDLHRPLEWRDPARWSADGLHPSPLGHQRFAEEMAELVTYSTASWAAVSRPLAAPYQEAR
jgi:lysophospholipase L1-like esterase